jgi:hypothetical protein
VLYLQSLVSGHKDIAILPCDFEKRLGDFVAVTQVDAYKLFETHALVRLECTEEHVRLLQQPSENQVGINCQFEGFVESPVSIAQ